MSPLVSATGRRWLAGAVVAAPLLIAVNSVFHPPVDLSAAGILTGAELGPARWFAIHIIAATGALLGIPAAFGLLLLVPHRGRRLAVSGVAATVVGGPLLAMGFAAEASALRLIASAPIDASAALAVTEVYTRAPEFFVIPAAILLTAIGGVLVMAALLVSHSAPAWQPFTYIVATLATLAAAPGSPLGPVAFAAVTAVSVFFAAAIVRTTTVGAPPVRPSTPVA